MYVGYLSPYKMFSDLSKIAKDAVCVVPLTLAFVVAVVEVLDVQWSLKDVIHPEDLFCSRFMFIYSEMFAQPEKMFMFSTAAAM